MIRYIRQAQATIQFYDECSDTNRECKMIEQLKKELAADEGCVTHTYLCSEGHLTVGIGHLCQEGDPEFWKSIGTAVSEDRVDELFGKDIAWTMADCRT